MTIYTCSQTLANSGTTNATLTSQVNNLSLSYASNAITGFATNTTYLLTLCFGGSVSAANTPLNSYMSVTTTNGIATTASYGNGVAVSNDRWAATGPVGVPNTDVTTQTAIGFFNVGATAGTLYPYVYFSTAGTVQNTTLIIERIS
jgi:hypothetical protein